MQGNELYDLSKIDRPRRKTLLGTPTRTGIVLSSNRTNTAKILENKKKRKKKNQISFCLPCDRFPCMIMDPPYSVIGWYLFALKPVSYGEIRFWKKSLVGAS